MADRSLRVARREGKLIIRRIGLASATVTVCQHREMTKPSGPKSRFCPPGGLVLSKRLRTRRNGVRSCW